MVVIKENAPLKNKSGGGYRFEHEVSAYFLSYLLANKNFDASLGEIKRIDYQMRGDNYQIDDLCITFGFQGKEKRLFLSAKSSSQFKKTNAPKDFVEAAWIDFTRFAESKFDRDNDLLGLACAPFGHEYEADLYELLNLATSQDSKDLNARLPRPKYTSERVRTFFSSFKCPQEIAEKRGITDDQVGDFLKHIKVYTFDFDYKPSEKKNAGISNCQSILSSGLQIEAEKLWKDLIELSGKEDESNGYIDLSKLLNEFRLKYKLKNFPSYDNDLKNLDNASNSNLDVIPDMIGGKLSLPRDKQIRKIQSATNNVTLILGISGSGKSVVAKKIAEQKRVDQRVLWFDAGWFNDQSISQLESSWRLSHSISELFTNISDQECWIVIDGLDRIITEKGFAQLFQIINSCNIKAESTPWKIIFTCQTEDWNNKIMFRFSKQGHNPINWNITDIELFDDDEIKQIVKEFPQIEDIFKHPHLKSLLLRPKIIDLLATYGPPDTSTWVGESDLIKWFWLSEVTNQEKGTAKSSFLLNIAERQADNWQSSVPVSEIPASDLVFYDDLESHGICTRNQNRIQFSHDIFGDWIRQQCLISHRSDIPLYLMHRYDSPLWHRGIRLFGLDLLEQNPDPSEYLKVLFSIQKDKNEFTTIHDLLLESIIFVTKPLPTLEKLWPEFKKDNGTLLKRFLKRFLIVATTPNRQVLIIGKSLGISENVAALINRIPVTQYWIPVIQYIINHNEEVEELAPELIADIAKSWLIHTPANNILSVKVSNIALTIAEKIKKDNSRRYYENEELAKKAYSAAISTINEDPERVANLLLNLSGKGEIDPSEEIQDGSIPPDYIEELLPPWPDGPYKRVDNVFQKMCVQENELTPVIAKEPELAKEILLGLIIEEPRRVSSDHQGLTKREFGLSDFQGIVPASPYSGPFLVFLNTHPSEGIDLITQIVNFATERYLERKAKLQKKCPDVGTDGLPNFDPVNSVEILLSGSSKTLNGDHEVYYWYRNSYIANCPTILSSMLMALEKFLYEKIDREESIDTYVQMIYEKTNSVAMLGVLTSVGKYKSSLFEGPLLDLFSVSEIYQWDQLFNERSLLGIRLPILDEVSKKQLSEWHSMSHRKIPFYDLAVTFFLNDSNLRSSFDLYRKIWEERLSTMDSDSEEYLFLYGLIQRLIFENYTTKELNGEEIWCFNEPEELKQLLQKSEPEYLKVLETNNYLNFLTFCSNVLKKSESFDQAQLEKIWNIIQTLSFSTTSNSDPSRPFCDEDVIAGGIAVLFVLGKRWLEENPDKKEWCTDQVFKMVSDPPPPSPWDSAQSTYDMGWDSFCAWAAPHIWAEDPKSIKNREMVLHFALSHHYKTIEIVYNSSFQVRAAIQDEFYQLVHLAIINAFSRTFCGFYTCDPTGIQEKHADFIYWINQQFQNFVEGKISPDIPPILQIVEAIGEFNPPKKNGGRKWNSPQFHDRRVLLSSFKWLSPLNQTLDADELECWIKLVKDINAYVIYSIKDESRPKYDMHLPDNFDRWYFLVAATFITEMTNTQNTEEIWQPFLDLEISRNHWTENFLSSWFIQMHNCLKNPGSFIREWQKMIEYALTAPHWSYSISKDHSLGEKWCQLIGIERELLNQWSIEVKEIVTTMRVYYEKWARYNLSHFHCLKKFTHFLTRPACSEIRLLALKWLEQYGNPLQNEQFWKDREQNEKLAELLNLCWENDQKSLVADVDSLNTFNRLLNGLTDHQVPLAMELTEKIRTSL